MYRLIRDIHLALGLSAFAFLIMYSISAVQMAHSGWFNLKPTVTENTIAVPAAEASTARDLASGLIARHGFRGELQQVREQPAGWRLRIVRPGTVYEVDYSRDTGQARVRINTAGFMGMMNRIHHIAGLNHEYQLINVWGALVLAVSIALFLIGATGVYLWFKIHTERLTGGVLLAASLLCGAGLLISMRVV